MSVPSPTMIARLFSEAGFGMPTIRHGLNDAAGSTRKCAKLGGRGFRNECPFCVKRGWRIQREVVPIM